MKELSNSDGDGLEFLGLQDGLFEMNVFNDLSCQGLGKVSLFSNVPPVIAVEGSVLRGLKRL